MNNLITEARERGVMYDRIKEEVESWPSTNADRIRGMSDEELAKELTQYPAIPCRMCEHHDSKLDICRAWASDFTCVAAYTEALTFDWLQQPAETEGTE